MASFHEAFLGKRFVCCAFTIVYSIYNTAGQSIASIYDLGSIFTSALCALVNMSPQVVYRMRFNYRRVYNSRICKLWCLKYSRVKYLRIYGSCRGAKLAGLIVGFVWRCSRIEWRAASEDFTSTRRYGRLSLEKGLVVPQKKQEKIRSLLQWREALKRLDMYWARYHASVRSSCGSRGSYSECLMSIKGN